MGRAGGARRRNVYSRNSLPHEIYRRKWLVFSGLASGAQNDSILRGVEGVSQRTTSYFSHIDERSVVRLLRRKFENKKRIQRKNHRNNHKRGKKADVRREILTFVYFSFTLTLDFLDAELSVRDQSLV